MDQLKRHLIFLSYANEDWEKIRVLHDELIKRRLKVWVDKINIGPGPWKNQIIKAISKSRYFLICLSVAALRKTGDERPGFQDEELNIAYSIAEKQPDKEFTIVPVRIENCNRGDIRLNSFQQYDLFKEFETSINRLAIDIGGISLNNLKAEDSRSSDEKVIMHLVGKAESAYYAGNYIQTLDISEKIIALYPNCEKALRAKGSALVNLNRLDEALGVYNKAIVSEPSSIESWYNKGVVLRRLKRFEDSIAAYDKAIELDPNHADAWNNKGVALGILNKYDDEIACYDKAIEIEPDHINSWYNKACSYALQNNLELAVKNLKYAMKISIINIKDAQTDPDFDGIRSSQKFKDLFKAYL
jgi:tetratricopeptide (TPR) repeat protein